MDDTTGPNSNVELLVRQHVGRQYHYYTGDTGEMRIQRNGQVTHWEFVTSAGGTLAFQVWRPVEDLGENQYVQSQHRQSSELLVDWHVQ